MFLLGNTAAYSQAQKGDQEILVSGIFFVQSGDYGNSATISGNLSYGIFVTDTLQIGAGPTISYSYNDYGDAFSDYSDIFDYEDLGLEEHDLTVDLNLFLRQHFLKEGSRAVYYVGGEVYLRDIFASNKSSDSSLSLPGSSFAERVYLRPAVGLKYYFLERAAFDVNIGYGFGLKKGVGAMFSGTFGVSFIF
jgi:hypothetical protein